MWHPLEEVSKLLGHTSVKTTEKIIRTVGYRSAGPLGLAGSGDVEEISLPICGKQEVYFFSFKWDDGL